MNRVKKVPAFKLVLGVWALLYTATLFAQDLTSKFDGYLNTITRLSNFSGSVLVARDGKVVFSKGYGMANLEFEIPNRSQTKFRLGSITKQFTAAAILILQERGKLSVQNPVCNYVDGCPASWSEITIHHLLTHTSGIPNYTNFPDWQKTMMIPVTIDSLIGRFKDKPLEFKPGTKMSYGNSGYVTLGYIIEKVAGESYESFLQKNIFGPLQMTNTGYDTHDKILKNRATGYAMVDGKTVNSPYLDMTVPYAAGALYSTVEDLFIWNEALFNDKLLSAKSREAMMTPFQNNYAYGLAVDQQFKRKIVMHGGGINGFLTVLARFPEEKVTIVVLRNDDYGLPGPERIWKDLAAIIFGEKYEIPRGKVVVKVDPKIYDAYAGEYQVGPSLILKVTRESDKLMGGPVGQPQVELIPESETEFFVREVNAQVTFVKDEKGQVTHLILNWGADREGKKIK
jgi:CubicO group peptidase (beta-lactamase class C family)